MLTVTQAFLFVLYVSNVWGILSPCARWNSTARTVAGTGTAGNSSSQIDSAKGLFIHKTRNELYVADFSNNRVQMFPLNQTTPMGITVAWNIDNPMKVFVDDGPTVYVSLRFANRIEMWASGATKGIKVGDDCQLCSGVAVDKDKNVYMSESNRHRVARWSPLTNTTTVVAGQTNTSGSSSDLLDHPQGIYVSQDGTAVYVADMWNSRVQLWKNGAAAGVTVAGSSTGAAGNDSQRLNYPNDVIIDEDTNVVYVIDTSNNRVQRWKPSASAGDTIAGGNGVGNGTNQLNKPSDLAFDARGNLYVMDMENNRVQMFALIDNRPCSPDLSSKVLASFRSSNDFLIIVALSLFAMKIFH